MIKLGTSDMAKSYVGSTEVSKMYLGSDLVYENNPYDELGYIKSGKMLHLDGSDFNGTQWKSRVGDYTYAISGSGIASNGNGGVTFNGNGFLYANSKPSVAYNVGTIEVVLVSSQTSWAAVYYTNNLNDLTYLMTAGRASYYPGANRTTKETGTITNIYTHSISHTHNYFSAVSMGTASTASWRSAGEYPSVIGAVKRSGYNASYAFKGTLYQLRIYNRILTENEILHNANIDATRYNISI